MVASKKGLGKGLDSLIPDTDLADDKAKKVVEDATEILININEIEPNRDQPRKKFDEDALVELSESIKLHGIIDPLTLVKKDGYYMIVNGERRWRAAKMAGLKKVPATIRDYTDRQIKEISLIDNIQREDLNPIEEALAYQSLISEFDLKQEEVAERVSKSRAAVANSVRLLKLSEDVRKMVAEDLISGGHGRALISIENPDLQYQTAMKVFDEKLSVRDTEKLVKKILTEKPAPAPQKGTDNKAVYRNLEEVLKEAMGTKVTIKNGNGGKGKIEIEYYSPDELERITELLKGIK
ncbi:MAG: ParB/RepB/Spo0J family partition protein [Lachnospiraceae bacterium]|jgi:ParB family chromosome partitioning protein|nr:ParB/RepB/Spo0J family partition protein [Lachnospiraceae bacterium]